MEYKTIPTDYSRTMLMGTACILAVLGTLATGCTGQLPGSFRYSQQNQTFSTSQEVNTKIDLLWVVDNSSSMDVSQQKLRDGFGTFARKYLKPTWDIRVAVITSDTYLAHPAFSTYLNTVIGQGSKSKYINQTANTVGDIVIPGRITPFVNPSYAPNLVDPVTGVFTNGIKISQMVPSWNSNWARLMPGIHDGPITSLCFESLPYFIAGASECYIRDDEGGNTGIENCVSPSGGESSLTQCVNTVMNDTVHSANPIISTTPPTGTPGDTNWVNKIIRDFTVNVSTGSVGMGSERGLGSVLELLRDNEVTGTAFFRPNSLRGIIFVSDEEDQSMELPSAPYPAGFTPWTNYKCDKQSLLALNTDPDTGAIDPRVNAYCCASGCTYVEDPAGCPSKTVGNLTYSPSTCPAANKLLPVASVKQTLDDFFKNLDGSTTAQPNYFIGSIVALDEQAIQTIHQERIVQDKSVGVLPTWSADRAQRYIDLGNLVGNGSMAMNIAEADYTPILDAIGRAIISKKGTFSLDHEPTGFEDMIVYIQHADGRQTLIRPDQYTIQGKDLVVHDLDLILSLSSSDNIIINYQPKNLS